MQALRGHRSIYQAYIFDEPAPSPLKVVERKGRSEKLKKEQNELIVCRYWYYMKLIRKNYPDTLTELEKEMFLSQLTLIRIIQASHEQLKQFQDEKPGISLFKKKYPFLVW